jgi:hypothetical protein
MKKNTHPNTLTATTGTIILLKEGNSSSIEVD